MEVMKAFSNSDGANVISEPTKVNRISSFGAASSSSSQVVHAEDSDVGNDQMVPATEMDLASDIIHHVISNADESQHEDGAVAVPQVPIVIVPLALIPSLRGKLVIDGSSNVCRGVWAMSDIAHDTPEQTSDFEFKLVKPATDSLSFPHSGKYQGWFALKQPPPVRGSIKIEDRDMYINFSAIGDGTYKVEGNGTNKFGKFSLRGMLGTDHMMQIYREYQFKPLPSPRKRSAGAALGLNGDVDNLAQHAKPPKKKSTDGFPIPGSLDGTRIDGVEPIPGLREGTGRARKPSSIIKDPDDSAMFQKVPMKAVPSLALKAIISVKAPQASAAIIKTESGRAQRPPPQMQKCSDLLKELMKMPQAIWFSEPVDPVKMNVPDYPTLIKQPMDFGTIRSNLDRGVYDSPEALADHIRLTFRNAITYNQLRDNPVHIAAREMAGRFEEKYRMMLTQLSSGVYGAAEELNESKIGRPAGSGGGARKSSIGGGSKSKSGSASSSGRQRSIGGAGPRPVETFFPMVVDGSAQTILAMQRQMESMASELRMLRTKVMQSEVKHDLDIQRDAAQNPLTFQEKKSLISKIHQLPASKMQQVVDIIQDAIPPEKRGEGDEIEVPLDELDTFTLRKLQSFVEEHNAKKKPIISSKDGLQGAKKARREKGAVTLGRPPGQGSAPKKLTGSSSSPSLLATQYSVDRLPLSHSESDSQGGRATDMLSDPDPLGDSIEEDDLFFSNESFDDLRAQATENGTNDASDDEESTSAHHLGQHRRPEETGQVPNVTQESNTDHSFARISPTKNSTKQSGQWQPIKDDIIHTKVANASAWTRRNDDNSGLEEAVNSSGPSGPANHEHEGLTAADLWTLGASELVAAQARERERKLDDERLADQRASRDAERITRLEHEARQKQEESEQREGELLRLKEKEASELKQRRLEEKQARESMVMTVDLESPHDSTIAFTDDM